MTLRSRISLTAHGIRLSVLALLIAAIAVPGLLLLSFAGAFLWLLISGRLLREVVLPRLFPSTICPGCRRQLPLVGRWKCGDHYTDYRDRHIVAFHCNQGHRLEGFDCPRCRSTILVQRGDKRSMRHGSALRLRTISNLPQRDGLLLGHDTARKAVCLPYSTLAWHMAMTGGTGRGKSTLLANIAAQLAADGIGFTVLDPGGDLARAILQQIPPDRAQATRYIDVGDLKHPFPLNVLDAREQTERALLAEELINVFQKLYGSSWGPLLEHQLRMALRSVMEVSGTLRDVYQLFIDGNHRTRLLAKLRNPDLRRFWTLEFPTIPPSRYAAVTNKLAPLVFHPILEQVICARRSRFDADQAIAERQITIVNLATGSPAEDVTTLLGTFIVQRIIAAAFRQSRMPEAARIEHVLVVDEFQRFMHRAAGFDQILTEARKFKLSIVVANQFIEQLADPVRAAVFGNIGCLVAFRVGNRDARVLLPEFDGTIAADLLELNRGQCLVRIGTDWTHIATPPPPQPPENDPSPGIIARSRRLARRGQAAQDPRTQQAPDEGNDLVQ